MKKFEDIVAKDIKSSLKAFNVEIDDNVARNVALEAIEVITIALRERAEQMSKSMSGMHDVNGIEAVIGILES